MDFYAAASLSERIFMFIKMMFMQNEKIQESREEFLMEMDEHGMFS